jgi:hypothetical protein
MRNTDRELIERFRDIIGVGTVYGPYERHGRDGYNRQAVWDWVAREEDGLDALALMWIWLSERRRSKALAATGIDFTCFLEAAKQLNQAESASAPRSPADAA